VHEGRAELQNTGPSAFSLAIASHHGGGLGNHRSYGGFAGSTAISVLGWLHNGHRPAAR